MIIRLLSLSKINECGTDEFEAGMRDFILFHHLFNIKIGQPFSRVIFPIRRLRRSKHVFFYLSAQRFVADVPQPTIFRFAFGIAETEFVPYLEWIYGDNRICRICRIVFIANTEQNIGRQTTVFVD